MIYWSGTALSQQGKGKIVKNPVLDDIMRYATEMLKNAYGYCGQALSDEACMLNSDDKQGNDIIITIKLRDS